MAIFKASMTRSYEEEFDDSGIELLDGETLETLLPAELFDRRAEMVYSLGFGTTQYEDDSLEIVEVQ